MICWSSTQMSKRVATTSMWVVDFQVGAGVLAVRIAERDVDAGELLVLQDVADHFLELDVGADRELADAIRVLVGVRVLPEIALELFVLAVRLDQAVVLDAKRQRRCREAADTSRTGNRRLRRR